MSLIENVYAGTLVAGTLLVVGPGGPLAAAVPVDDIPVPNVKSVSLGAPNAAATVTDATVTFTDASDDETGYLIEVRERNSLDNILVTARFPPVPGTGREATQVVSGIPVGAEVCADVVTLGDDDEESRPSSAVCADPAEAASDVALQNIRGNAAPESSAAPAYLIVVDNPGGAEATGVDVSVSTSGVATLGDQAGVAAGWAANGFACSPRPASGGETSALSCTGGTVPKGGSVNPAVIVRFTGPGPGAIHAQVSGAGDKTPGNNGSALNVTAR